MKREAEFDNPESADKLPKTMANKDSSADQVTQFISPASNRPNPETQRYDRQLRLWQNIGQQRVENSSIGLWDSGATSTQIAKNLALAGVGRLNLFDGTDVRQSDIGNNFFLEQSSLGQKRVKACRKFLAELNRSCFIDYEEDDGMGQFGFDYDFEDSMQCHELKALIAVRMDSSKEDNIRDTCWRNNVPAIFVQTCGLVATITVELRELGIIEPHSESLVDLRLDCPFPAMSEFVNSFELEKMSNHEHAHIPAVVILIKFLDRFKSEHDGKLPQNSIQREELKSMILAEKRSIDEDNFDEAVGMIWKACQPTKVPAHIEKLFNDKHCKKIPKFAPQFWFLVKCLREFVKQNPMHQLPLSGVLPDMKSDTNNYVKMQSIYRQKAAEDLQTFRTIQEKVAECLDDAVVETKHKHNKNGDGDEKKVKDEGKNQDVDATKVKVEEKDEDEDKKRVQVEKEDDDEDMKKVKEEEKDDDQDVKVKAEEKDDDEDVKVKAEEKDEGEGGREVKEEVKNENEAEKKVKKEETDEEEDEDDKKVKKEESDEDEDEDEKEETDEDEDEDEKEETDEDEDEDEKEESDEAEGGSEDEEEDDSFDGRSCHISVIPDEVVEIFVKNCAHLRLLRRESGYQRDDLLAKFSEECEPDNEEYTATWFLAFQAMGLFRDRHQGHYPGTDKGKEDEHLKELYKIAGTLLSIPSRGADEVAVQSKASDETKPKDSDETKPKDSDETKPKDSDESKVLPPKLVKALQEIVRSGGSELPHISSLVGGLVAQEVIKLLTEQYVPLNATCVFDGYRSTTGILKL